MSERRLSIIIPNYNGAHVLEPCLRSIGRYVSSPYEIIVVDNGSTDDSVKVCLRHNVKLIALPDNRGFPAACNRGLWLASGDELLLLNNDTQMTRGAMEALRRCLHSSPDIGIVGPMTNFASGRQQMKQPFTTIARTAARINRHNPAKWRQAERIVGLCFLFKRELMERIGMLDERFTPGHFEDDDYCFRARQAGYRLMIAGDSFVYHHGSVSFKRQKPEQVQELIRVNRAKFMAKWQVDPFDFI
ncbi:Glycosyltransferase, GT2 family [Paenibacillus sp. UNCCL117]|uniref:glycosyltransferase family 2 protein n=1 Tax=unclassified Paenibacillus TaxID=185978 RepID=UPI00088F8330|nr:MULTISPECIES: glycosyltransferase family 2 protein [unclassified Paenibacillus]SDD30000.1 Glycosyltransferase, GT2 family [Paenibacillus sp. cl123]SFW40427.1 Glycosyltransferase, GT2 family [Paenibacillus sp. UNCCL117]